jgi:hypothetical protein
MDETIQELQEEIAVKSMLGEDTTELEKQLAEIQKQKNGS